MNAGNSTMADQPDIKYIKLVAGQPFEDYQLALIVKRTYDIRADGTCALAEEQEPIEEDSRTYDQLEPPLVSPTCCDNDCFAFKEATDIIVQGMANTYGRPLRETTVELKFQEISRQINIYGDRVCDWGANGHLTFSDPEPFEKMPIRYDRAYGGQDRVALKRHGDLMAEVMGPIRPEWKLETTSPFHYPRNPAGTGYLINADKQSIAEVKVPNLEYPFDPVTPERMSIDDSRHWLKALLPACFDWCDQSWFPRLAYLGMVHPHEPPEAAVSEVELGWAAADVLECESLLDLKFRIEFLQGASAGLFYKGIRPDERFWFRNMFPQSPEQIVQLPGEIPYATVTPKWKETEIMEPFLNTVVIRPEDDTALVTWSCRVKVLRPYAANELEKTPFSLSWKTI